MSGVDSGTLDFPVSSPVFWQLSFSPDGERPPQTVDIDTVRFRVGRRKGAELVVVSPQLSGRHAEFVVVGMRLFVRDLASTNGTYVNGRRIGYRDVALRDGDQVRLANVELMVHRRRNGERDTPLPEPPSQTQFSDEEPLTEELPRFDFSKLFGEDYFE